MGFLVSPGVQVKEIDLTCGLMMYEKYGKRMNLDGYKQKISEIQRRSFNFSKLKSRE